MLSQLVERKQELPGVWSVLFTKPPGFRFVAGDYTELELDYPPNGGRRWFSLSSAPSEEHIQITFKLPDPHSRFKDRLMKLNPGDKVQLAPPMGNFNLPLVPKKVLFVAIGIGVTPFRSIVLDQINSNQLENWDMKMIHAAKPGEFLFENIFNYLGDEWQKINTRPRISPKYIAQLVADSNERMIFLAGPETITANLHSRLAKTMPLSQLRLSYFPGYKVEDS